MPAKNGFNLKSKEATPPAVATCNSGLENNSPTLSKNSLDLPIFGLISATISPFLNNLTFPSSSEEIIDKTLGKQEIPLAAECLVPCPKSILVFLTFTP